MIMENYNAQDQAENQKEQEKILREEKEAFQAANGFSDEENEYIAWKHDVPKDSHRNEELQ